jgi:pyruvate ferredoxin oxidoreductase beta subunit
MASFKEIAATTPQRLAGGHRMCAGCGATMIMRQALHSLDPADELVVTAATGCMEVSTTIYPYSAWRCSYIHNAFENSGATCSGAETAYRALKKKNRVEANYKFLAFGGDGGTYDIGLQSLSGAMERGHDMVYLCYDNEAYMNTGYQRSGATPHAASTTTAPAGKESYGKVQFNKDLTGIMAAHRLPFVAQAVASKPQDFMRKMKTAFYTEGPCFVNALSPCIPGWRVAPNQSFDLAELAVETCFWPLYEVVDGEWKLNYKPKEKKPVVDWLMLQGRFRHLFKPDLRQDIIEAIQHEVDRRWHELLLKCGEGA